MCRRQQKIAEMKTAMRQVGLVTHPDAALSDKILNAYDNINRLCFDDRLPPGEDTVQWSPTRTGMQSAACTECTVLLWALSSM